MQNVSSFPLISKSEFEEGCHRLSKLCEEYAHLQYEWLSVDVIQHIGSNSLRIVKALPNLESKPTDFGAGSEEIEVEDGDEEALVNPSTRQVTVEYDIVLSPSYQVPVLYFNIKDPNFRYPPTMETLYRYIIPPQFKAQAGNAGVIGGITMTDHPITNMPVFFIHPCQTAKVLEASVGSKQLTPDEYLTLWLGAMGACVGLSLPVALAQKNI